MLNWKLVYMCVCGGREHSKLLFAFLDSTSYKQEPQSGEQAELLMAQPPVVAGSEKQVAQIWYIYQWLN